MSVRFVIGRSGVGKTKQILDEIKVACDTDPQGTPIFVVAPDQMTFHLEYQLLKQSESQSLMRVQGVSFNRLAYRVLQETGGLVRYHLDTVGTTLLLQKVMNEHKDELSIFKYYANKPGFIKKISEMISEFKSYAITPEQLVSMVSTENVMSGWSMQSVNKVKDIAKMYEQFEALTMNKYLMSEDYYTLLIESLSKSEMIKTSDFYVDGYHLFNKQEELLLIQLMKVAKSVTVVLTHDEESVASHFEMPKRTFNRLTTLMEDHQLSYEMQTLKQERIPRYKDSEALAHLEAHYLSRPSVTTDAPGVAFFQAPNRRLEVEELGNRIYKLVHEQGAAYSDIAIYTNDGGAYYELFNTIFPKFNIPIFLDYSEKMIHHPMMTLLYHLPDALLNQWRYESLFTILKTGLLMDVSDIKSAKHYMLAFSQYQKELDVLENYCLSRNIMKKDWLSDTPWEYNRYMGLSRNVLKSDEDLLVEALLNKLKNQIVSILHPLEQDLKNAKTYVAYCEVLFGFLESIEVPQKLHFLEEYASERQDLKAVKQHQQVWTKLITFFEQIVEIGKDEDVSFDDFTSVLKAGLDEMEYATVPPRLDQVYMGECKRSRYQLTQDLNHPDQFGIRHAFVIGVNEGVIPQIPNESSLLSEVEREQLKEIGIELAPSLQQTFEDELFILYTVLTSPKETLTLSYVSSDDEGKEYLASHIFTQLKEMFLNAPFDHISRFNEGSVYEQLTTVEQSVQKLIAALKANPDMQSYYEPLLNYYETERPLLGAMVQQLLHYDNSVTPLDLNTTKAMYGPEITASVSRIELFNKCEFAHYVRYGLLLKERELYKVDLPQIGELYHESLKRIAELIKKENRTFADLTLDECLTLSQMTADELSEKLLYKILKQNRRMMMLKEKLVQVVYKTLVGLKYQGKHSNFKPLFFEMPFATQVKEGIKLQKKPLPNGFELALKGVIDRIDLAQDDVNQEAYLRVVDYKSSEKKFELDEVYYGLSLQLLTYLDVTISNALQLIDMPADIGGLLYFHVHRPMIDEDKSDLLKSESLHETLIDEQMKKYKMTGYLPADQAVAHLSDSRLEEKLGSDIVPVKMKKDGDFSKTGTSILTGDTLDLLRDYANYSIEAAANKMIDGQVNINPVMHEKVKACAFCQYREICQYDPDFLGNQKRQLPKLKTEVAIEAMNSIINPSEEGEL